MPFEREEKNEYSFWSQPASVLFVHLRAANSYRTRLLLFTQHTRQAASATAGGKGEGKEV
jgi:hypothetical protein